MGCYTSGVDVRVKDEARPLGQGQVCFYFRQWDDLFKPSNLMTSTAFTRGVGGGAALCCFTHVTQRETPPVHVRAHLCVCLALRSGSETAALDLAVPISCECSQ